MAVLSVAACRIYDARMTALIGRRMEVQRLVAAVDRARRGSGGIVLLSGEAGVGKTRLAGEVARRSSDVLLLSGSASHSGSVPYGPVVAALRSRLRSDPGALADLRPARPAPRDDPARAGRGRARDRPSDPA
jgi:hypothetical protein